jgi:hypothetical protein
MRGSHGRLFMPVMCVAAVLLVPASGAGGAPPIDAQADAQLKRMCSSLAGLKAFSVTVEETVDETRGPGQLVERSNRRHVTVSRPDRLAAEMTGDAGNRQLFYDGKTVTIFDRTANLYGSAKAPPTIHEMLDDMFARFGHSLPMADFLFPDAYKVLTEQARSGTLVGQHRVGSARCFHLAFQEPALDWQIWIDAGERPLPRRLVVVFKQAAGSPRYSATLDDWDLAPQITEDTFIFKPPAGARRIEFLPRSTGPAAGTRKPRK